MKRTVLQVALEQFPQIEKKELHAAILCGELYADGGKVRNPKERIAEGAQLELRRRRFVSRGGEKLSAAIAAWGVPVAGSTWVDAGSSTGGFTDALLKAGAARVYAVDVGRNQLAFSLRNDARVTALEETSLFDLRHLDPPADYACCDLSFRSLAGAAAHLLDLTRRGRLIALLKPQFELRYHGRGGGESFDGVLREPELLRRVLLETLRELRDRDGAIPVRILESPVRGAKGNREFLLDLRRQERGMEGNVAVATVESLVESLLSSGSG